MGNNDKVYGRHLVYQYPTTGNYTVVLNTYDDQGLNDTLSFDVEVVANKTAPIAMIFTGNLTKPNENIIEDVIYQNESLEFWGNFSVDMDGQITNYTWNITHVESSNYTIYYGSHLNYTFLINGTYNCTLLVRDNTNLTNTTFILLEVTNTPMAIIVQSTYDSTIDTTVWCNGSLSFTINGENINNYTWYVWNDTLSYAQYYYTVNCSMSFSTEGMYWIELNVTDSQSLYTKEYSYFNISAT